LMVGSCADRNRGKRIAPTKKVIFKICVMLIKFVMLSLSILTGAKIENTPYVF